MNLISLTNLDVIVVSRWLWDYDPAVFRHSHRVSDLLFKFARHLGMDIEERMLLHEAGVFHDIGKLQVPLSILQKPGKLTSEEFQLVKRHTKAGYEMLLPYQVNPKVVEVVLYHHENYDGTGYPTGLAGEDIPLYARMTRIVDSFDAMINIRTYREAMPLTKVMEEIEAGAHSPYDPQLVREFLKMMDRYRSS
jgi:putative nucleotidyltransferase with HDIG domain